MIGQYAIATDIGAGCGSSVDLEVRTVTSIGATYSVPAVQLTIRPHHDFRVRDSGIANKVDSSPCEGVDNVDELTVADEHRNIAKVVLDSVLTLLVITELVLWCAECSLTAEMSVKDPLHDRQWLDASRSADGVGDHGLSQNGRDLAVRSDNEVVVAFRKFKRTDIWVILAHAAAGQIIHIGTFQSTTTIFRDVGIAARQNQRVRPSIEDV